MRVVLQRVTEAAVSVDGRVVGRIGRGSVLFIAVRDGDTEADAAYLARKCVQLRIFENEAGKFDTSLIDIEGELLAVSQFTLYADCSKGRRPSFIESASPEMARPLYDFFVQELRKYGLRVETGMFAKRMSVEIHNDGPVTLILDSNQKDRGSSSFKESG